MSASWPPPGHRAAVALALGAALALTGCPAEPERAARRPNVVLISIDSLRADHLGCYGYPRDTSPFLDELAASGVRFEAAISSTSWTLPAHASMFTGLWDSTHGLVDNGLRLAEGHLTLAELFRDAGYHTAGFFGGPYLHPTFGLAQGFDVYRSCMTTSVDVSDAERVRDASQDLSGPSHRDVTGPRTTREVTRWIAERPDDRPYLLFLHLWDVHYDYIPPPEYVRRFDPDYDGPLTGVDFSTDPAIHAGMPARDLEHLIARYDAEIRFTDDQLRLLFARLSAAGMLADTIVVVTADHGEEFFEHGNKGHQLTLYDEVIRVPLIVAWPGRVDAGRSVELQVRSIDLLPTLAALAGLETPEAVQGRDLSPLLRGEVLEPVPALSELLAGGLSMRALRTEQRKALRFEDETAAVLFDLSDDPGEQRPWAPGSERKLERREWGKALRALSGEARSAGEAGPGAAAHTSDPEVERRLRSLGYVE